MLSYSVSFTKALLLRTVIYINTEATWCENLKLDYSFPSRQCNANQILSAPKYILYYTVIPKGTHIHLEHFAKRNRSDITHNTG